MAKADLDALASTTDTITEVQKRINIIPVDKDNKPIVYEDSPEGIAKYAMDVAEQHGSSIAKKYIDDFFAKNPNVASMYLFEKQHGNLDGFKERPRWKDFSVENATDDQLKTVIVKHRKSLGDDDETIELIINKQIENKNLKSYATKIVNDYIARDNEEIAETQRQIEQQELAAKEANTKYWNEVQTTITSGKLTIGDEVVTIPEVLRVKDNGVIKTYTRKDFFSYLYDVKPFTIDNKQYYLTQHQYELTMEQANRNVNNDILDALRRFVKQDTSQIITSSLKTQKVADIRKFETKNNKPGTGANSKAKPKIVFTRN